MSSNRILGLFGALCFLLPLGCGDDDKVVDQPTDKSLAAKLCDSRAVAPSADGTRVAFLSCSSASPTVVVHDLSTHEEVTLGEVPEGAIVDWLPSARSDEPQKYVLFGTPAKLSVRAADASAEAVLVAEGDENALHRAILQRISNTEFSPRLHVLQTVGGKLTLTVRGEDDAYAAATETYSSDEIVADLSQISASGRTLILTPGAADSGYTQVQWNTTQSAWQTSTLPFGPGQWVMAPVGLGDTHNFALHGDELVRVELKTGKISELVPSGEGLLDDASHLVDREDAPGTKYVYFIVNGDPTRRDRDGAMPAETLAEADAVAQRLTPDLSTLLYLSDGALYGLPAEGGASELLVDASNETTRIDAAFPGSGSAFAYIVGSSVYRVDLADGSALELSGVDADRASVTYDGLGTSILLLDQQGNLLRVPDATLEPETVTEAVSSFWPVANSSKILAVSNGILRSY